MRRKWKMHMSCSDNITMHEIKFINTKTKLLNLHTFLLKESFARLNSENIIYDLFRYVNVQQEQIRGLS